MTHFNPRCVFALGDNVGQHDATVGGRYRLIFPAAKISRPDCGANCRSLAITRHNSLIF